MKTTPKRRKAWDFAKIGIGASMLLSALTGYVDLRAKVRAQMTQTEGVTNLATSQVKVISAQASRIARLEARISRLEHRVVREEDRGTGGAVGVLEAGLGPRPGALEAVGNAVRGAVSLPFRGLWALVRAIGS